MNDKIKNKKILFFILIFVAVMAANIFIGQRFPYVFTQLYFKLFNHKYISSDIVIVAIDEDSLNDEVFQKQEISRNDYAKVLENILRFKPKAVGLDVFFNQKSNVIYKEGQEDPDEALSDILSGNDNVVIANEFNERDYKLENTFMGKDYLNFGYSNTSGRKTILNTPTESYRNIVPAYDYASSGNPLRLRVYQKVIGSEEVSESDGYRIIGGHKIPIQDSSFNINFFGNIPDYRQNNSVISFIKLYYNSDSTVTDRYGLENLIKDKIVLIGATSHDLHDEFYTPYNPSEYMPGVLLHANMINSLLVGKYLTYMDFWVYVLVNAFFVGFFMLIISRAKNNLWGFILSFVGFLLYVWISIISFIFGNVLIEVFPLFFSYFLVNLALYVHKYFVEKKSKNDIKKLFGKYVSKNVVDEIVKVGVENLRLGGTKKEITVFFSDLAGFTNISENMDPENLGKILNVYFETMSNIILDNKGTIDKFIGDAIMCFWNAPFDIPHHQSLALFAAVSQRKAMHNVRQKIKEFGFEGDFDMRIGINTGGAVIGNFGSSNRHDYTALGDTVNLASRLESLCKYYGVNILASKNTIDGVDLSKFLIREIDTITVKGKAKPIVIYEIIGFAQDMTPELKNRLTVYAKALNLYRQGDFVGAKSIFEIINDGPSSLFVSRCDKYIFNPPKDFDGIYRFDVK